MSTRKKWQTKWGGWRTRRHQSKVAAYRWIDETRQLYRTGQWSTPYITVQFDDGSGWKTHERVDFRGES